MKAKALRQLILEWEKVVKSDKVTELTKHQVRGLIRRYEKDLEELYDDQD